MRLTLRGEPVRLGTVSVIKSSYSKRSAWALEELSVQVPYAGSLAERIELGRELINA